MKKKIKYFVLLLINIVCGYLIVDAVAEGGYVVAALLVAGTNENIHLLKKCG